MTFAFFPAHLSPYPSASPLAVQRVAPRDYPKWDGLVFKLGPVGFSVNWRRR